MNKYKWDARDYKQNSQNQKNWGIELLNKLSLTGSECVLDIGCGDGRLTAEIAKLLPNGKVVGIDNSESMISLASETYSRELYPNLSFEVMDAGSLSFTECFDVVFSNAALHWIKDHKPVINGIRNSLKTGGRIFLQMGGEGNAGVLIKIIDDIISGSKWSSYFNNFEFPYGFFGVDEYKNLLESFGFKVKRIELLHKDMNLNGIIGLDGWIRTTWLPYTKRIPEEKRDEFIREISSRYIKQVPMDNNGVVHVSMVRLEVEAEKQYKDK